MSAHAETHDIGWEFRPERGEAQRKFVAVAGMKSSVRGTSKTKRPPRQREPPRQGELRQRGRDNEIGSNGDQDQWGSQRRQGGVTDRIETRLAKNDGWLSSARNSRSDPDSTMALAVRPDRSASAIERYLRKNVRLFQCFPYCSIDFGQFPPMFRLYAPGIEIASGLPLISVSQSPQLLKARRFGA
jgi:hypothetical protein